MYLVWSFRKTPYHWSEGIMCEQYLKIAPIQWQQENPYQAFVAI